MPPGPHQVTARASTTARQAAAKWAAVADYHGTLKRKYEHAAARRLLSVEPDPPEPSVPWELIRQPAGEGRIEPDQFA
jgi:hypothetical protein